MAVPTCESCGALDAELVLVRRLYVTPETWDTPASVRVVDPPEQWCVSCCSHYPHEPVEPDARDEPGGPPA